jgi:hypothetical protein
VQGSLVLAPSALVASAAGLYWGAAADGGAPAGMRHASLTGTNATAFDRAGVPSAIALAGGEAFYTVPAGPGVTFRDALDLGAPAALQLGVGRAVFVAADGAFVFAASSTQDGNLARARLDNVGDRAVLEGVEVTALAARGGHVMWATPGAVHLATTATFPTESSRGGISRFDNQRVVAVALAGDDAGTYAFLDGPSGVVYRGRNGVIPTAAPGPRCVTPHALVIDDGVAYAACGSAILRIPL